MFSDDSKLRTKRNCVLSWRILLVPFARGLALPPNRLLRYNYGRSWSEFWQRNVISRRLKFNFESVL